MQGMQAQAQTSKGSRTSGVGFQALRFSSPSKHETNHPKADEPKYRPTQKMSSPQQRVRVTDESKAACLREARAQDLWLRGSSAPWVALKFRGFGFRGYMLVSLNGGELNLDAKICSSSFIIIIGTLRRYPYFRKLRIVQDLRLMKAQGSWKEHFSSWANELAKHPCPWSRVALE